MSVLKETIKTTLLRMGYRVTRRRPENRFAAMEETLLMMKGWGYQPTIVIDAGANIGQWLKIARPIFPEATFHMIEPQPACAQSLEKLVWRFPNLIFHQVALTEPGIKSVRMIGVGNEGGSTGGYVAKPGELPNGYGEIEAPAKTLDEMFANTITRQDRAFLKLDLENHEIPALMGATHLLGVVEVILTELQFFEVNNNGRPIFPDFVKFLDSRGFQFYDFACLFPRPRDLRLRQADAIFVRRDSSLMKDSSWQ